MCKLVGQYGYLGICMMEITLLHRGYLTYVPMTKPSLRDGKRDFNKSFTSRTAYPPTCRLAPGAATRRPRRRACGRTGRGRGPAPCPASCSTGGSACTSTSECA